VYLIIKLHNLKKLATISRTKGNNELLVINDFKTLIIIH
jgi:hypothetical protein